MNKDIINETIRLITESEILIEMANLVPKKTGLQVDIWADHKGILAGYQHNDPRVKIGKRGQYEVSVTIEPEPKIEAQTPNIKSSEMKYIKKAMEYIGRNYDLFLKHFNDKYDEFGDDELREALQERGEYK